MCKHSNAPRENLVYKTQNALAPPPALLADVVVELMEEVCHNNIIICF